jgi:hypothetical protein
MPIHQLRLLGPERIAIVDGAAVEIGVRRGQSHACLLCSQTAIFKVNS